MKEYHFRRAWHFLTIFDSINFWNTLFYQMMSNFKVNNLKVSQSQVIKNYGAHYWVNIYSQLTLSSKHHRWVHAKLSIYWCYFLMHSIALSFYVSKSRGCKESIFVKANQRMKVVKNYIWFPVVHENSLMLKFEIPTPQFFSVVNRQFRNKAVKVDPGWASVKTVLT